MLIDEATEGLAPKVRDDIWSTLRMIRWKGVAVVVVDKNIDDLVDLAERHVVLAKGEAVFEGTSKQLRADWESFSRMLGSELSRQAGLDPGVARYRIAIRRAPAAWRWGIGDTPNRSQGTLPDMPVERQAHMCMGEADEVAS